MSKVTESRRLEENRHIIFGFPGNSSQNLSSNNIKSSRGEHATPYVFITELNLKNRNIRASNTFENTVYTIKHAPLLLTSLQNDYEVV